MSHPFAINKKDEDLSPICLIIPPSPFLLDERVFMSLGILRVAAVLEQAGLPVEVVDLSGVENFEEAIRDHVRQTGAQTFGLTATTPQMPAVKAIRDVVREERRDAKLILGGPHMTLVHAAAHREKKKSALGRATKALTHLKSLFDVLVAGDGEVAIFAALDDHAPQIIDADDPKTDLFLTNAGLEALPFPARNLVDVESYQYQIEGTPAMSLIAQLGCPFACGFCGGRESAMLRRIRTRSTASVVEEIVHLHQTYGMTGFMFYDDELNVNPQMVGLMNELTRVQKELGVEFRLRGFIKAELFTDEQAEAMYRAGFRWILTGFESGSPQILVNINKKATREDNSRCVAIARKHGLKVKALMSLGHPGESEETARDTHKWLLEAKPDDFDVTIITTYPGTPYYDHAEPHSDGVWAYTCPRSGDKLYADEVDYTLVADYYKGDPDGGYQAFVFTDDLEREDLVRLRDFIERDVRRQLGIAFNTGAAAIRYEHSMGQTGPLPSNLLRKSKSDALRLASSI
jgi:anaerobic magnesium-protoporphyrin IX monomethyl ester cyclase